MRSLLIILLTIFFVEAQDSSSSKTVTIINAKTSVDGSAEMYSEILEECIDKLPALSNLKPTIHSKTAYLRSINGKKGDDNHVRMYTAEITISYIEAQKMLLVLTQESIQAQEPKTEIFNRRIQKKIRFVSDSNNGDSFANQSRRIYYFSTADAAKKDVIAQAEAWLSQNSAALCQ